MNYSRCKVAVLLMFVAASSFAQSITITNPILKGFYPDPSILQVGEDYYLVNSTFSYFPGIPVLHSKDLKNWKQIGNVIDRPEQMDFMGERMTRGLFAPAIMYYKGIYYVTCTDIDHEGNFVATATNPAGPWSKPVKLPEVRGIDPSIFFDETTDKAYIIYNSDAPDNKPLYSGHRTLKMYELDYKNLKVLGEPKIMLNGGVDLSTKPVWIEAPHIFRRNGWYYMYAAEGGTSVNHSEVILRSKDVWGPYVPYEKNPILTQRHLPENRPNAITSAGHAQFVDGPDGKTYMVFLAVRPYEGDYYNTGRETFIVPVKWVDDWPVADLGGEEIKYQYTASFKEKKQKNARPQSGNFAYTIKFKDKLEPEFLFMRTEDKSSYNLSKKKGLTLKLKPEKISELGNPSFIGKRQQHLYSYAETSMAFQPASEKEKAGLVIFQDERHYYFLAKAMKGNEAFVVLYKSANNHETEVLAEAKLSSASVPLTLKIESMGDKYSFYYAEGKASPKLLLEGADGKFLSTKVAGGFIGCLYGLYATSSGDPSTNTASFKYLKYAGNDPTYK